MITDVVLNNILQTGLLAITIPVVLIVAWKMYSKKSLVPFWSGILVFIAFAVVMEGILHMFFIAMDNPVSRFINGNAIIYALYGGLMAGLFEEGGRYFAFRVLLGKHTGKETAVTYGIGHGGIECILALGVTYIQYYAYGQLINNGKMEDMIAAYQKEASDKATVEALKQTVESIKEITPLTCYMASLERVSGIMLQIAFSILVFAAVRMAGKTYLLWVAMALHAAADFPAALYQKGMLSLVPVEIILFVYSLTLIIFAVRFYGIMHVPDRELSEEEARKHWLHQIANKSVQNASKSSQITGGSTQTARDSMSTVSDGMPTASDSIQTTSDGTPIASDGGKKENE